MTRIILRHSGTVDKIMGDGLVTLEKVRIIRYRGTAPT